MSRKMYGYTALLATGLLAASLAGCGSDKKGSVSASSGGVATVGDTACLQCHSAVNDPLTGESIVAQYNKSVHFQNGLGCESCHGGGAQHNGVGPIPFPNPDAARCATCHTGTNATQFANSNHALLDLHYSATSSSPVCLRCHSHEGAVLFNQRGIAGGYPFLTAATTTSQLVLDRDGTKFQAINCQTCHEHGGALRAQYAQDGTGKVVAWDPNKNIKVDQFDLCTGCHTFISNDGSTIVSTGNATNTVAPTTEAFYHYNRWTRMIATTHYDNPATTAVIEGYAVRTKGANPCFDCHGHEAKTATGSATESTIHTDWAKSAHAGHLLSEKETVAAGYVGSSVRTDQTNAVLATGATDATGPGWVHYDWDKTYKADGTDSGTAPDKDRADCQRCHTATGAANYMTSPSTYDPANNDFTHLSGWVKATSTVETTSSGQNEVLYCWGCHSNAGTGVLRTPGAITAPYTNAAETYPNVGNSNVCLACHTGRESGNSVANSTGTFTNLSFINSHYLTAGGTVFGKTGYALGGREYNSSLNGFVHDKLGVSATGTAAADAYIASNGLSTSGPCAVCHMTSEQKGVKRTHTYSPFSVYSTTVKNTALNPVCVTCHTSRGDGSNAKSAWFEATWKVRADAGLEALKAALALRGIHFYNAHPYFYTAPYTVGYTETGACTNNLPVKNWQVGGTSTFTWSGTACTSAAGTAGTAGTGKDLMGVAFNYNTLAHDPGAVAHNRYYVRRLIYDSLDYLDDLTLNYSVFATLNALDGTVATYKADAITFLINRGTADANVGTAAERY